MADWLLYEHDDGRHAVAPSAEAASFAHGDPAWHRVWLVEVTDGLARALQIVEAEIARAEALLNVEDGGEPVFDRAQTEAGIAALRTVAEAIRREANAGVTLPRVAELSDAQIDALEGEYLSVTRQANDDCEVEGARRFARAVLAASGVDLPDGAKR